MLQTAVTKETLMAFLKKQPMKLTPNANSKQRKKASSYNQQVAQYNAEQAAREEALKAEAKKQAEQKAKAEQVTQQQQQQRTILDLMQEKQQQDIIARTQSKREVISGVTTSEGKTHTYSYVRDNSRDAARFGVTNSPVEVLPEPKTGMGRTDLKRKRVVGRAINYVEDSTPKPVKDVYSKVKGSVEKGLNRANTRLSVVTTLPSRAYEKVTGTSLQQSLQNVIDDNKNPVNRFWGTKFVTGAVLGGVKRVEEKPASTILIYGAGVGTSAIAGGLARSGSIGLFTVKTVGASAGGVYLGAKGYQGYQLRNNPGEFGKLTGNTAVEFIAFESGARLGSKLFTKNSGITSREVSRLNKAKRELTVGELERLKDGGYKGMVETRVKVGALKQRVVQQVYISKRGKVVIEDFESSIFRNDKLISFTRGSGSSTPVGSGKIRKGTSGNTRILPARGTVLKNFINVGGKKFTTSSAVIGSEPIVRGKFTFVKTINFRAKFGVREAIYNRQIIGYKPSIRLNKTGVGIIKITDGPTIKVNSVESFYPSARSPPTPKGHISHVSARTESVEQSVSLAIDVQSSALSTVKATKTVTPVTLKPTVTPKASQFTKVIPSERREVVNAPASVIETQSTRSAFSSSSLSSNIISSKGKASGSGSRNVTEQLPDTRQDNSEKNANKQRFDQSHTPARSRQFAKIFRPGTPTITPPRPREPFKPKLPLTLPFSGSNGSSRSGKFLVEVRRRGVFKPVAKTSDLSKAMNIGSSIVSRTVARSFRVKGPGRKGTPRGFYSKKGNIFVEKSKFSIDTLTEKVQLKGSRRKKR